MLKILVVCKCGSTQIHNKKRNMCSPCYYHWYNTTQRNKKTERQRQATYRQKYPERSMWSRFKRAAKKSNILFDITPEWIKEKLDNGVCEITGLPLITKQYKQGDRGRRTFFAPSLDRIDNTIGYTKENTRMVCWSYNLIKNNYTDRDVNAFAISIMLEFVHKKLHKDLLSLIPNYFLSSLPSQSKHAGLIKEVQALV